MTGADQRMGWFVGWDVGAWNCDTERYNAGRCRKEFLGNLGA